MTVSSCIVLRQAYDNVHTSFHPMVKPLVIAISSGRVRLEYASSLPRGACSKHCPHGTEVYNNVGIQMSNLPVVSAQYARKGNEHSQRRNRTRNIKTDMFHPRTERISRSDSIFPYRQEGYVESIVLRQGIHFVYDDAFKSTFGRDMLYDI